ncbi:MAG: hypothetical protein U9R48_08475 [Chloroflexota bacterium]|nr:hypothetical protein [Chloroflexota bacterium]
MGALIHAVDGEDPTEEEEWGLVSTYAFSSGLAGHRKWRQRWRIENTGFRELKEGRNLERASWSYTEDSVVASRHRLHRRRLWRLSC